MENVTALPIEKILGPEDDRNTTGYETFLVILPSFFYTSILLLVESSTSTPKGSRFVLEFFCLILPLVLGMTLFAEYTQLILVSLVGFLVSLLASNYLKPPEKGSKEKELRTYFLTNARSTINTLSVIAILAVDFSVFPGRFMKNATFGYSLMDTGVGLYVYANGIVSAEALNKRNTISKSIRGSVMLFIVGIVRLLIIRSLNYSVSTTEYGVHWNFFITLGATKLFACFFLNVFKVKHIYITAFLLIVAHQVLLKSGLEKFVFENENDRDTLIKANKEGLVSSFGFVSLYLFSVYFGYILNTGKTTHTKFRMVVSFFSAALICLLLSVIFQQYFGISRRLANAAYCFWVLFLGIFMTGLFYLLQIIQQTFFGQKGIYSPYIFEAINYNGLVFFLIGNLLTTFVNMSINTGDKSNPVAIFTLALYMLINCGLVSVLYSKSLKLKL